MRVDELIAKLEEHKTKHGNTLVRFRTEIDGLDTDWRIDAVYPVNIYTSDAPVIVAMLSTL